MGERHEAETEVHVIVRQGRSTLRALRQLRAKNQPDGSRNRESTVK